MTNDEPSAPAYLATPASRIERTVGGYVARAIHALLIVLAVVIAAAAAIATCELAAIDFPRLFDQDVYDTLQRLVSNILLIAIAAELGLLLVSHSAAAAIEVILFMIARKIVGSETTTLALLLGVAALSLLVVVRFYFLRGTDADRRASVVLPRYSSTTSSANRSSSIPSRSSHSLKSRSSSPARGCVAR